MKKQQTIKYLYNPIKEDFTVNWAGDENNPQPYTLKASEIMSFPLPIANHIQKHLAEYIYQLRGRKTNHDDDIKEIIKEIEVNLDA